MERTAVYFPNEVILAVEKCLFFDIPFALVMMPGSDTPRLYSSFTTELPPLDDKGNLREGISIGFFGENIENSVFIPAQLSFDDILAFSPDKWFLPRSKEFPPEPTRFIDYYAALRKLIREHKRDNGKTVVSRIIESITNVPILTVAARYFERMRSSFRYLYYTPETDLWIGASPEILYQWDANTGNCLSMALAGTRKKSSKIAPTPWDDKNIDEHNFVIRHIESVFHSFGIQTHIQTGCELPFGHIEHLCHLIEGNTQILPARIIDALNPTPAVCGWPLEKALQRIYTSESHSRNCYAGAITVTDNHSTIAFVNLRCAFIVPYENGVSSFSIYAGGGITKNSDPVEEWNEAASKATPLYVAINKDNEYHNVTISRLKVKSLDDEFDKIIKDSKKMTL